MRASPDGSQSSSDRGAVQLARLPRCAPLSSGLMGLLRELEPLLCELEQTILVTRLQRMFGQLDAIISIFPIDVSRRGHHRSLSPTYDPSDTVGESGDDSDHTVAYAPSSEVCCFQAAILVGLTSSTLPELAIGITRGFMASGISRTRSTWRSPFSRLAPLTFT